MRIVVALGGNALLERGERPDAAVQRRHARRAAQALAPLAERHELVICHGNGPQVGMLALESVTDASLSRPFPLDVLTAQTQGMIGYWLVQELHNAGLVAPVIGVLTQTVVASDDPAFARPTKFIGPGYARHEAQRLAVERRWQVARDGTSWRRVVASPLPQRLVEEDEIARLVDAGVVVVCGGGGGISVAEGEDGLVGVEAVVDKDRTAALLATTLQAEEFLVLTDVAGVYVDFGTPGQRLLTEVDATEAESLGLPDGSMGPKVTACLAFARATGRPARIGALDEVERVLRGEAGTVVRAQAPTIVPAAS